MGLSKATLERCKHLTIVTNEDGSFQITVTDPRFDHRVMDTYRARTPVDCERVKRAWTVKFNIPKELVFDKTKEDPSEYENMKDTSPGIKRPSQVPDENSDDTLNIKLPKSGEGGMSTPTNVDYEKGTVEEVVEVEDEADIRSETE